MSTPTTHAMLSPSSAERWLHCTPSARLETQFPDKDTDATREGTAAHALAEHKVRKALKQRTQRPTSEYDSDEMEDCTDQYRDYVIEQLETERTSCPDAQIEVEVKLDLSDWVPGSFGTSDCLIVSDRKLHVIDFKYGQGVLVDATDNAQMKLYALGAIRQLGDLYDFQEVELTIFQPRRQNVSSWTTTVKDLSDWAEKELKPKAALADKGEGGFSAGGWCLFCKAKDTCRARADQNLAIAKTEFALDPPELLTDEEISQVLAVLPELTKWAADVQAYALREAVEHGKQWAGFKVVAGRSIRKYKDENAVAEAAEKAGYTDIWNRSLITLTQMEKLMGKKTFQQVLGDLVVKPEGKPTLVPESDKRPAITTGPASEFTPIENK